VPPLPLVTPERGAGLPRLPRRDPDHADAREASHWWEAFAAEGSLPSALRAEASRVDQIVAALKDDYELPYPEGAFYAFPRAPWGTATEFVAAGIERLRGPDRSILLITHYPRLLEMVVPDRVHVLREGRIERSGDATLAAELATVGFDPGGATP